MRRIAIPLIAVMLAGACGRPPAAAPAPAPASCDLLTAGGDPARDSLVIGVPGDVDRRHAPIPATEAERLVFGTFYETLVSLDCGGAIRPALAQSGTVDPSGHHWTVTLRDARFWDGTPLGAPDVIDAWRAAGESLADSAIAVDDRTLLVDLPEGAGDGMRRLADPALAVALPSANGGVPQGTGVFRVVSWTADRIVAERDGGEGPTIVFRTGQRMDPRDLLDQGADLVVTDDLAALGYARSLAGYQIVPLPWAWTYVFQGPPPVGPADLAAFSQQLASDAVRGDARAAEPPYWWADAPACPDTLPPGAAVVRSSRIVYSKADPVARDLADRLVALGSLGDAFVGDKPARAVGLAPDSLSAAIASGTEFGYVLAVPRRAYAQCARLGLRDATPLLEARSSLIARPGRVAVEVEWDGAPRLVVRP